MGWSSVDAMNQNLSQNLQRGQFSPALGRVLSKVGNRIEVVLSVDRQIRAPLVNY
ncbi:MAG: hypothetical protein E5299_00519 [Burkholderia gladioli]|nr:MAG: hypothetical protein E5299_00519 [Burkholderia gladioli]